MKIDKNNYQDCTMVKTCNAVQFSWNLTGMKPELAQILNKPLANQT